jgi:hypothetical protein
MIESITYWLKLENLRQKKRRIQKKHKQLSSMLTNTMSENADKLINESSTEDEKIKIEIAVLETRHIQELADRYNIQVPKDWVAGKGFSGPELGQGWSRSSLVPNAIYLNEERRLALLKAIRTERRERWDRWVWWIPLVTGLIVALTGLARFILKK